MLYNLADGAVAEQSGTALQKLLNGCDSRPHLHILLFYHAYAIICVNGEFPHSRGSERSPEKGDAHVQVIQTAGRCVRLGDGIRLVLKWHGKRRSVHGSDVLPLQRIHERKPHGGANRSEGQR